MTLARPFSVRFVTTPTRLRWVEKSLKCMYVWEALFCLVIMLHFYDDQVLEGGLLRRSDFPC